MNYINIIAELKKLTQIQKKIQNHLFSLIIIIIIIILEQK